MLVYSSISKGTGAILLITRSAWRVGRGEVGVVSKNIKGCMRCIVQA